MSSSRVCTLPLDVQDDRTLPHNLLLLITQYHAITKPRSYCVLPSNSWRPFHGTLGCTHPGQGGSKGRTEFLCRQGDNAKTDNVPRAGLILTQAQLCYGRPTALHAVFVADLFPHGKFYYYEHS